MRAAQIALTPESDLFEGAPHPRLTPGLFGHDSAEQSLLDAYRSGRMPQAIIIGGQEGVGKATLAWRLARFIAAHPDPASAAVHAAGDLGVPAGHPAARRIAALAQPDVMLARREWNAKTKKHFTEIQVESMRDAIAMFHFTAGGGGWRICIVDCAEDLNKSSANAILKIMEEPPPRSLFIIVAHKPGNILPTLRSRSRLVMLRPLSPDDVARAISALGGPWGEFGGEIAMAAGRSGGSVRQALRLLDSDRLALAERLERMLDRLPDVDWAGVHALAESVSRAAALDEFEALTAGIFDWLGARARNSASAGANLAPLAQVWEKLVQAVRDTEALNLDKRALVLTMFIDLSAAAKAAGR